MYRLHPQQIEAVEHVIKIVRSSVSELLKSPKSLSEMSETSQIPDLSFSKAELFASVLTAIEDSQGDEIADDQLQDAACMLAKELLNYSFSKIMISCAMKEIGLSRLSLVKKFLIEEAPFGSVEKGLVPPAFCLAKVKNVKFFVAYCALQIAHSNVRFFHVFHFIFEKKLISCFWIKM